MAKPIKANIPAFLRKTEIGKKKSKPVQATALDRLKAGKIKAKGRQTPYFGTRKTKLTATNSTQALDSHFRREHDYSFEAPIMAEAIKEEVQTITPIGAITHFFERIGVGVIRLNDSLELGDTMRIGTHNEFFEQVVISMQMNKKDIEIAGKGDSIGIKLDSPATPGTLVWKI